MDIEKDPDAAKGLQKVLPRGLNEKLIKHSHDADAALQAYEGLQGQVIELTEEKSKALLRKIDWHMMPVSTLSTSLDKTT
jgi:ACS family allantoate permease-like MFS transporter